ncbi:succinylglutamate desuccinylase/aspartoacylase family protein [Desulfovibrio sp. OttesenSCG-928-I05]|nr:succinylglutamate desuccinylase/aspartoacylase family protein [Desulfovibrio sp. OttesenSCG-928-I05]
MTRLPRLSILLCWLFILCAAVLTTSPAQSAAGGSSLDFSMHRMGPGEGPTLLVIGGIQGDEPGGFSAAALLTTHYTITRGEVWVVPNLNFPSIITRSRGNSGDMNRKFAHIDAKDPDYHAVRRIQEIILDPQVDLVLNLHDGSGFYRPHYENELMNPKRWGQCVIIDQEDMDADHPFSNLIRMADAAVADANMGLLKPEHQYHTRNTRTREGDKEMEKSLSYFALRNGKAAFGVEASKNFTTEYRSYYHICILESFMRQMGIEFTRHFPLSPKGVQTAINSNIGISLCAGRVVIPLDNVRPAIAGYVPLRRNAALEAAGSSPLLAVLPEKNKWQVAYGNRRLTLITPEYLDFDDSLTQLELVVDGKTVTVFPGEIVWAESSFLVRSQKGFRVNAIGARKEKKDGSECEVELRKADFMNNYSIDVGGTTYRVEIYKGKAFAGMFLVRFGTFVPASGQTMTATQSVETRFGF